MYFQTIKGTDAGFLLHPFLYKSEERYLKLSECYEKEQSELTEKVRSLKSAIDKRKQQNRIRDFIKLVDKYSDLKGLTPEIIRPFMEKIIVHEKRKENGHSKQKVEIFYTFIGAAQFRDFVNIEQDYDLNE